MIRFVVFLFLKTVSSREYKERVGMQQVFPASTRDSSYRNVHFRTMIKSAVVYQLLPLPYLPPPTFSLSLSLSLSFSSCVPFETYFRRLRAFFASLLLLATLLSISYRIPASGFRCRRPETRATSFVPGLFHINGNATHPCGSMRGEEEMKWNEISSGVTEPR